MQLRGSQSVGEHRPDIVVGNLAFEIELNHKRKETLTRNVLSNELNYDGQVWLVPQRKANIRRSLAEIFADIRTENRADFANIPRCKVTHRHFS